jgi:hypothetical protein
MKQDNDTQDDFGESGRELLFKEQFELLPVRARNILQKVMPETSFLHYKHLVDTEFDFLRVQNAGRKTVEDLTLFHRLVFVEDLTLFNTLVFNEAGETTGEQEQLKDISSDLCRVFTNKQIPAGVISRYETATDKQDLPLFTLFTQHFIPVHKKTRARSSFSFILYQDGYKLIEVAKQMHVTRERVRQIQVEVTPILLSFFQYTEQEYDVLSPYLQYLDDTEDFHDLDALFNCERSPELAPFSKKFLRQAFAELYRWKYELVEHCPGKKQTLTAMVSKQLSTVFNFKQFVSSVTLRYNKKKGLKTFDVGLCLNTWLAEKDQCYYDRVYACCEKLAQSLFGVNVDEKGIICFAPGKIDSKEYVYLLLKENGAPMHFTTIEAAFKQEGMPVDLPIESLRGSLNRHPAFLGMGGDKFGLKEWEGTKDDIKGGSIRNIVEELLQAAGRPLHSSEIFTYVTRFRKTTRASLTGSLRQHPAKFRLFRGEFFGLIAANYTPAALNKVHFLATGYRAVKAAAGNGATKEHCENTLANTYKLSPEDAAVLMRLHSYKLPRAYSKTKAHSLAQYEAATLFVGDGGNVA